MAALAATLIATIAGGLLSVLIAAAISHHFSERFSRHMIAFAVGSLLATACFELLPEAMTLLSAQLGPSDAHQAGERMFAALLSGLLLFFALERLALWRHSHAETAASGSMEEAAAQLILVGDAVHNFVDGVLIAAAFVASPSLGIATTLAIMAHEIPQELGDFSVMLHAGWSRRKALLANTACSLSAILGGVIGYLWLAETAQILPYILITAASSFLYISISDLLPLLHRQREARFMHQAFGILAGLSIVAAVTSLGH